MADISFTQHQQSCIDAEGGNILVSAAAGSGKTAVLTERVIRLLTGENPISADRLVIVTFTVAAADEMKARIRSRLSELIALDPQNQLLQNQQLLLSNAKISTIHALCSGLIKDHFQELSLPGEIRICDETELEIIKQDAIEQVFSEHYEKEDDNFLSLVAFWYVKNDKRLIGILLSLYNFIRSFPFPKNFLKQSLAMYAEADSLSSSVWYDTVKDHVISAITYAISILDAAMQEILSDSLVTEKYMDSFVSDKQQLTAIIDYLLLGEWDKAVFLANHIDKQSLKPIRNYEDKAFLENIKDRRVSAYKILETVATRYLAFSEQDFLTDIAILTPQLTTLFSLVEEVYDKVEEMKLEKSVMDYADLEHYTVKLLVTQTDSGYEKTEIAIELSKSFDEIMIDECQDINEVQNLIFQVLSRNQENLFMVGDVKQSIYRFRKASPKLFVEKRKNYPEYNPNTHSKEQSACIILEQNFRSREEVCDIVNYIFSQIMSEEMGEINYNHQESLIAGAKYPDYKEAVPEIHVIDYEKDDERERVVVEAQYIAARIQTMIQEKYLVKGETGEMRPCRYRDFAILIRAKKDKANMIAGELKAMDIPCFSDSTDGYFNEYEVTVVLNLLKVIDNPLLDIPLVSVLMSPMFGFHADDITNIRLCGKNVPFYIALTRYTENGDEKGKAFLQALTHLREKAAILDIDELIQEIYDQTDFISLAYVMGNGEQKDANLRLLLTYAKQYQGIGRSGLSGFLRYIDRIIENKQDFSCANIASPISDTVKIMTIHSSKGLEFPICILADCGKKFNTMDLNQPFQMNSRFGFGMKINEMQKMKSYTNLPFEAIRLQTEKEAISEEMRVLYVALTRAKEKLIITMTMPKPSEKITRLMGGLNAEPKINPYAVYSCKSYGEWVLMTTLRHSSMFMLRQEIGTEIALLEGKGEIFGYLATQEQVKTELASVQNELVQPDVQLIKELKNMFDYKYPFAPLTKVPAKLTPTQISKQKQEAKAILEFNAGFMQKQGFTPKQRGTILHSFMQYADYEKAKTDLSVEIQRLVKQRFLTEEEADALNQEKIQTFLTSSLYERMHNAEKVLREYKFLYFISASEIDESLIEPFSNEPVLIQGIADCVFFEEDGLVIVDYKTDVTDDEELLRQRYSAQLKIYKKALEEAFCSSVKECLIYSVHIGKEILIETK